MTVGGRAGNLNKKYRPKQLKMDPDFLLKRKMKRLCYKDSLQNMNKMNFQRVLLATDAKLVHLEKGVGKNNLVTFNNSMEIREKLKNKQV